MNTKKHFGLWGLGITFTLNLCMIACHLRAGYFFQGLWWGAWAPMYIGSLVFIIKEAKQKKALAD